MRKVLWQIGVHILAFASAMIVLTFAFQMRVMKALYDSES